MARCNAFTWVQTTETRYAFFWFLFVAQTAHPIQCLRFFSQSFCCLPHTGFYRPRKLGHSFPRLYDIVEGEAIATLFLQLNPEERIGAEEALNHSYFAPLPRKLFELPDGINELAFLLFHLDCFYWQKFSISYQSRNVNIYRWRRLCVSGAKSTE